MIRIATILGTVRPGNYTSKVLNLVHQELENTDNVELARVDPAQLNLGFPGQAPAGDDSRKVRETIANATGVILATPEYHGSFSSVLKMIIETLGFPSALAGKPVSLLGVAGGQIGAIKSLEHLRSVCSHVGAIVLPGPVSIARVQSAFDEAGNVIDEKVDKRVRGLARQLLDYIHTNICPRIALEEMVRE